MRCIFLLLSISLSSCINFNETVEIYDGENGKIFTESGVVTDDTVRIMFDDFIPRFNAAPAYVDYFGKSPIIVNQFHEPVLFKNDQALFEYMFVRGYDYNEIYTFTINNRKQSAWIFIK